MHKIETQRAIERKRQVDINWRYLLPQIEEKLELIKSDLSEFEHYFYIHKSVSGNQIQLASGNMIACLKKEYKTDQKTGFQYIDKTTIVENGAAIVISTGKYGYIFVFFYPFVWSDEENSKPFVWRVFKNARDLDQIIVFNSMRNDFISYLRYTSGIMREGFWDRWRCRWLQFKYQHFIYKEDGSRLSSPAKIGIVILTMTIIPIASFILYLFKN